MWFGTRNGLNKYDGEKFIVYKHDNTNPHSLSDNHITALQPDNRNNGLWVGTINGLNYIDLSTNIITSYNQIMYPTMAGDEIISLSLDNDGLLWIGTRTGLCVFSPESKTFRLLDLHEKLTNEPITAIYSTDKGQIFIGTHSKGLFLCNRQMKVITHLSDSTSPSISDNGITAIFKDSKEQIWIGTSSRGINKWDLRKNEITQFVKNNSGLTDNNIRCFEEQNSNLIIGTFDGLSILDLRTDSIIRYNNFDVREGSLSHFSVYSLYSDKVGTLWVGTYSGGVNYHNPQNNRFTFYHPQNEPNEIFGIFGTMVYHPDGVLWIATEGGGLLEFDPDNKTSKNYLMEQLPQKTYNNNIIKSLMVDKEFIWCGTNKGAIYKFHIKTKTFSLFYQFDKEKNLGIYSMFRDKQNNLWIGTTAEQGLFLLTKDGKLINQFAVQGAAYPVSFSSIRSFMEVRDGVYLIGTRATGLFEYNIHTNSLKTYNMAEKQISKKLQNNYITAIMHHSNGDIWIGTFGGGIYLYNEEKGIVRNLNTTNGLIDNNVCSIVECDGNLWISTGSGISELNVKNMQFRNYNRFNGIEVREFTPQGGIRLPDGDLYFSGSNGFLSFNSRFLTKNKFVPPVVLTQLSINNKVIEPNIDSEILTKTIDDTDKLILKYNQSNISIAYCALNYIFHQQNQYAYKLIGHDDEWNYVGTRKEAYYTNVAPGEYTFLVIASNNDGLWNREGKSIRIIVLPPWWKTPFAYTFYALLTIGICSIIWYYMRSKQKLEQDLQFKQIEKQKLEEFHQTKTRLFTNFSHELRTPLTLIISPLEEVLKQIDLNLNLKDKLSLMYRNSQKLLLLVNQLMDLQKNQAGNMKLKVSQEDLNTFLLEIYYAFKQIADSKQINFSYEASQEEVTAYFDHALLEKVVFNLLSNAFKFVETNDSIKLILRSLNKAELNDEFGDLLLDGNLVFDNYFLIQVADTGKGIPEKERLHIFTPFYQIDDSHGSNINGTGIGLSLTQSIVKLHHGMIVVKENKPKGSIFTVIIPMDKSAYTTEQLVLPEQDVILNKEEIPVIKNVQHNLSFKTILLVEDNQDIRAYLKEYLSGFYQIIEADNGVDAFDKILKHFPDLVISDIMMPKMDGLELCSLIKKDLRTGHIPVILITARTMVMHIKEGFLSGADDYVVKPFNMEVLQIRVNNLLVSRDKLKETYGKKFSLESMGIETTSADERFMQKFFAIIEEHLSDPDLNVELICREIGFSRANFYRKLKAITELPPAELIKNKRLEIAVRMLHDTDMNITEISMHTGFSNPAYFAKCFKSAYGVSPTEYIQKQKKS